jgi:hypothetical protein
MPDNAVYVGRPSKWGNPLQLVGDTIYIHAGYRRTLLNPWVYLDVGDIDDMLHYYWHIVHGTQLANPDLQYWSDQFKKNDLNELRGKDLACWCPLTKKCHADILIEICKQQHIE